MTKRVVDPASEPDEENPEWTNEDFRDARPALEVIAEVFSPEAAAFLARRGRPAKPDRKVNQTLRIDPDVLEAFRQEGKGWQTRINQVLRENMPQRQK
jgi:uncharacterized protein (DUF4415 family)